MAGGMINYVRIIEQRPAGVTIRRWRAIRHGTMRVMGLAWHQEMLPEHFKPNAKYVYHYKARTRKWEERKKRAAARGRDTRRAVDRRAATDQLTYSGTLRQNVTQVATIRTFQQRFKLIMPGTAYTPDRPRSPSQPPIAQEVTTLLAREKKVLAKLGKAHAVAELKAVNAPAITNIR